MELVRIVSVKDFLECIFPQEGTGSTFVFRNPLGYRNESLNNGGDPNEQETIGLEHIWTTQNNFLVSCWHCLEDRNNISQFFDMHRGENKVAIASTVSAIDEIARNLSVKYIKTGFVQDFSHQRIGYYDYGLITAPSEKNSSEYCLNAPFRKPKVYNEKNYEQDKEYRFAYRMSSCVPIERIVFCVNPTDYIKRIYLNSNPRELVHKVFVRLNCWGIKFSDSELGKLIEISLKV